MKDLDNEIVLEKSLENELDPDDETLNLLVPEANYHAAENPTMEKTLEEGSSSKTEKEVKRKNQRKRQRKKQEKKQGKINQAW